MPNLNLNLGFRGKVDPLRYLVAGVVLFILKFLIDYLTATFIFHRSWTPLDYVAPGLNMPALLHDRPDRNFFGTMMLIALPFTYIGLVLTVRRLRSAGMSQGFVLIFFLPVLTLFYFILLSLIPTLRPTPIPLAKAVDEQTGGEPPIPLAYGRDDVTHSGLASLFPESAGASMWVAIVLTVPVVIGLTVLATMVFRDYGFGLFLGMPFVLGLTSSLLHGVRKPRTFGQCLGVASAAYFIAMLALLLFGFEGTGCLLMLMPLALPIALMGAMMGYTCQKLGRPSNSNWRILGIMLLTVPMFMGAERIASPVPPCVAVTSSVEVDAAPEVVWKHVIDFPPLPEPTEWIFRIGIAYPKYATIDGTGPGAIRRCVFSTGAFVEPIEVWDAPHLLKFSVTENPPPMREWSPYRIHPPHLDNFLSSQSRQFQLIPLPGGRTKLVGTTWYRQNIWPVAYWQLWSDYLIHRIHLRVLNHVKELNERDQKSI